eukprot:scaffold3538_cov86-Skeletonema_dohrnii-CCMP3373.AAC.9
MVWSKHTRGISTKKPPFPTSAPTRHTHVYLQQDNDDDDTMPLHGDYWLRKLQWVKDDDSETTQLVEGGDENYIQDMSDEGWEELVIYLKTPT